MEGAEALRLSGANWWHIGLGVVGTLAAAAAVMAVFLAHAPGPKGKPGPTGSPGVVVVEPFPVPTVIVVPGGGLVITPSPSATVSTHPVIAPTPSPAPAPSRTPTAHPTPSRTPLICLTRICLLSM